MVTKKKRKISKDKKVNEGKNTKKEEVSEIFKIEKDGKEKIVEAKGKIDEKIENKGQRNEEKKQLVIILSICVIVIALVAGLWIYMGMQSTFNVNGIKYDIVKQGKITFYHTIIPIEKGNERINYNVYLRTDPRELVKIPFNGNLRITEAVVLNITDPVGLNCDGDGVIAVANLRDQILVGMTGAQTYSSESEGCSPDGIYTFMNIEKGEETAINEIGKSCYQITVKDCEVLPATERMIIEIAETMKTK
ncbi:MAG: hypothetical protein Q7S56_03625 [Nanoarchaeota archaeon]|nr:hypothetical protein [Nanoarchaeota archaeon]